MARPFWNFLCYRPGRVGVKRENYTRLRPIGAVSEVTALHAGSSESIWIVDRTVKCRSFELSDGRPVNKESPRMTTPTTPQRPGYKLIFRPFITLKNGKKLFASAVGLKAFPLWVPE